MKFTKFRPEKTNVCSRQGPFRLSFTAYNKGFLGEHAMGAGHSPECILSKEKAGKQNAAEY